MKYFIDTEFIENGRDEPLELLSLGIICEDGREFYAVNKTASFENANDWVKENVIPYLGGPDLPIRLFSEEILKYIGLDEKPEFWGYYADYDWVIFCQLFGTMLDLPRGWPMFCMDLKQLSVQKGSPRHPEQSSKEHNALNDARWNFELHKFLTLLPD